MGIEDFENGEESASWRITRELGRLQKNLVELEQMQPLLHEDIENTQARIGRLLGQIEHYDKLAEEKQKAGQLSGEEDARVVAKGMDEIIKGLQAVVEDRDTLLDTKMVLENAIAALREERNELLEQFPRDPEQ